MDTELQAEDQRWISRIAMDLEMDRAVAAIMPDNLHPPNETPHTDNSQNQVNIECISPVTVWGGGGYSRQ